MALEARLQSVRWAVFPKAIFENKINGCGSWGALLSANANNGANAGFGYLNTNNRATNAWTNNALRLYRYPFGSFTSDYIKRLRDCNHTSQNLYINRW